MGRGSHIDVALIHFYTINPISSSPPDCLKTLDRDSIFNGLKACFFLSLSLSFSPFGNFNICVPAFAHGISISGKSPRSGSDESGVAS